MRVSQWRVLTFLGAILALGGPALAQTATQNLGIDSGNFAGTIDGKVNLQVKSQTTDASVLTRGLLNVTDLDISVAPTSGPGINVFPSSTSLNNTAQTPINISPTTIGITIGSTSFNNGVTGSFSVTADDTRADFVPGVLDSGTFGSDGAWDDFGQTGMLNNASMDQATLSVTGGINAPASVSGVINASIPSNVTIPNVVSGTITVDLQLKNTSTVQIAFSPTQNVSIQNLSMTTSAAVPLNNETSGNFTDGNHPVPGATAMLDLSTSGAELVSTLITGNLVMDVQGTVSASIDLAAIVKLNLGSFGNITVGTFNLDNVINGPLSSGSLLQINEEISLPDTTLPFALDVRHNAGTNVDFDAIIAELISGTLGFTIPIDLSEQDVVLALPPSSFELFNQSFNVNQRLIDLPFGDGGDTFARGTVTLQHLAATLTGNVVMDINADMNLNADLFATALQDAAINVFAPIPEPSSLMLAALGTVGVLGAAIRRRRQG